MNPILYQKKTKGEAKKCSDFGAWCYHGGNCEIVDHNRCTSGPGENPAGESAGAGLLQPGPGDQKTFSDLDVRNVLIGETGSKSRSELQNSRIECGGQ